MALVQLGHSLVPTLHLTLIIIETAYIYLKLWYWVQKEHLLNWIYRTQILTGTSVVCPPLLEAASPLWSFKLFIILLSSYGQWCHMSYWWESSISNFWEVYRWNVSENKPIHVNTFLGDHYMVIRTLWGCIWEPSSQIEKGSSLELCNIHSTVFTWPLLWPNFIWHGPGL